MAQVLTMHPPKPYIASARPYLSIGMHGTTILNVIVMHSPRKYNNTFHISLFVLNRPCIVPPVSFNNFS